MIHAQMEWLQRPIAPPDAKYEKLARQHQNCLTKPNGALGQLETIAIRLAALQKTTTPTVSTVSVCVFAGDHGVASEAVSAFPQEVSAQMVDNFARGGAAMNVLANYVKASTEVVDVGLANPCACDNIRHEKTANGTSNFTQQPAMTLPQLAAALNSGKNAAQRAHARGSQLFIGGEMGIANTTSASAIAAALTNYAACELTGAGTGLQQVQIAHKILIIERGIARHQANLASPLQVLQHLGGFEIAALTGAYIHAAQQGVAVLVDGFIATVAALAAVRINPAVKSWLFYAHNSSEAGHRLILRHLQAVPLLDLQLRLGEASGALLAVPILQMACKIHCDMATFTVAKVTDQLTTTRKQNAGENHKF